jgi:molybdopterin-synthase adenylyltransferase
MGSLNVSNEEFSVAIPEIINNELTSFLVRDDMEEDLCFALYNPSEGSKRTTALIKEVIFPEEGDRQRHGNVSFNSQYFKRVCKIAMKKKCGVAFIHSHPGTGWQGMSTDDINAEKMMAPTSETLTGYPLVGLTEGNDGAWSARIWVYKNFVYQKKWALSVRVVGTQLSPHYDDKILPKPKFKEEFKRTLNVWGELNHSKLTRLRIGIVGLGSVGSAVAECLARMGMQRFTLIDFDEVQRHNLDRLIGASKSDIGRLKVDIAQRQIHKSSTASNVSIICSPFSIAEQEGYISSLDCDVIFSCVDRPRARNILNHISYNHLIPVIDGGIKVRMNGDIFSGVDWQVQTVGPTRPCLKCLSAYDASEVSLEIEGMLDDPSYIETLPENHGIKRNENIFAFSMNLASLEVFQLIALVTNMGDVHSFDVQRYRYAQGIITRYQDRVCSHGCDFQSSIADGDKNLKVYGSDLAAKTARERQKKYEMTEHLTFFQKLKQFFLALML